MCLRFPASQRLLQVCRGLRSSHLSRRGPERFWKKRWPGRALKFGQRGHRVWGVGTGRMELEWWMQAAGDPGTKRDLQGPQYKAPRPQDPHSPGRALTAETSPDPERPLPSPWEQMSFPLLMVLNLQWCDLQSFDFTMVQKWYAFRRNCALNFEVWSFPRTSDRWDTPLSWCWLGQWPVAPSQPWDYEGEQPVHLQPFCFSLLGQYPINYMVYSTLYYQTGFVLGDFALNTCNVA